MWARAPLAHLCLSVRSQQLPAVPCDSMGLDHTGAKPQQLLLTLPHSLSGDTGSLEHLVFALTMDNFIQHCNPPPTQQRLPPSPLTHTRSKDRAVAFSLHPCPKVGQATGSLVLVRRLWTGTCGHSRNWKRGSDTSPHTCPAISHSQGRSGGVEGHRGRPKQGLWLQQSTCLPACRLAIWNRWHNHAWLKINK